MKIILFVQIMVLLVVGMKTASTEVDFLLVGYKGQVPDWFQVEVELLDHEVYCRGKVFDFLDNEYFSSSVSYQYHFSRSDVVDATLVILSDCKLKDTTILRWPPQHLEVFYARSSETLGYKNLQKYNCSYRLVGAIRNRILRNPERFEPIGAGYRFAPLDSSTISASY